MRPANIVLLQLLGRELEEFSTAEVVELLGQKHADREFAAFIALSGLTS